MHAHCELGLLRSALPGKVTHLLRTVEQPRAGPIVQANNQVVSHAIRSFIGIRRDGELGRMTTEMLRLAQKYGGMGIHTAADTAKGAYVGSRYLTQALVKNLMGSCPPLPAAYHDFLQRWSDETGEQKPPPLDGNDAKDKLQHRIYQAQSRMQRKVLKEWLDGNLRERTHLNSIKADKTGCNSWITDLDGWRPRTGPKRYQNPSDDTTLGYRVTLARYLCIPVATEGAKCVGCGELMDVYGDHALTCKKGSGGGLGSWQTHRHDETANHIYRLGRDAGFSGKNLVRERREYGSNLRPADLHVVERADGGPDANDDEDDQGQQEPQGDVLIDDASNRPNQRYRETSYDVTITATQKPNNNPHGGEAATGEAGAEASKVVKAKRNKYKKFLQELKELGGAQARRRLETLAFESSGYTHGEAKKLITSWAQMAEARMGLERALAQACAGRSFRTRQDISTTIHWWNSVSIISRCELDLTVLQRF